MRIRTRRGRRLTAVLTATVALVLLHAFPAAAQTFEGISTGALSILASKAVAAPSAAWSIASLIVAYWVIRSIIDAFFGNAPDRAKASPTGTNVSLLTIARSLGLIVASFIRSFLSISFL